MDAGEVFSAPPAEGLRVLASLCVTGDADDVIHVLDISRAHQHCDLTREALEQRVKRLCVEAGARQGAFNPCTFYPPEWKTVFMYNGDDFVIKGARGQTVKAKEALEKGFMVKDGGILGSRPVELKTLRILNLTLRWVVAQNGEKEPLLKKWP
eukprot:2598303-Amphidinium_carterae.1